MRARTRDRVLVSAHRRGAAGDVGDAGLAATVALGVDHVELDVQRCGDDTLVVLHDAHVDVGGHRTPLVDLTVEAVEAAVGPVVRLEDALRALVGGPHDGPHAHLDLKLTSPDAAYAEPGTSHEVRAVRLACDLLGADRVLVTTLDDRSARVVRDWADEHGPALLVGLSLGRSVRGLSVREQVQVRRSELRPAHRLRQARADVVVAHQALALLGVAAIARRQGLRLLVWTVDGDRALRWWLRPGRAWLVTTNRPARALQLRARWDATPGSAAVRHDAGHDAS